MSSKISELLKISRSINSKYHSPSICFGRSYYDDKEIGIETKIDGRIVKYPDDEDPDDAIAIFRAKQLLKSGDRILVSDIHSLISAGQNKSVEIVVEVEKMFKCFCLQQHSGVQGSRKVSSLAADIIKLCRRLKEPEVAGRILSLVEKPTYLAQLATMDLMYKHEENGNVLEVAQRMLTANSMEKQSFLLMAAAAYKMGGKQTLALVKRGFTAAEELVSAHGASFAAALAMEERDFEQAEAFLAKQTQASGLIPNLRILALLNLHRTDHAYQFFRTRVHQFFLTGRMETKFCNEIVGMLDAAVSRDLKSQLEYYRRICAKLHSCDGSTDKTLRQLVNQSLERNSKTVFKVEEQNLLKWHQAVGHQSDLLGPWLDLECFDSLTEGAPAHRKHNESATNSRDRSDDIGKDRGFPQNVPHASFSTRLAGANDPNTTLNEYWAAFFSTLYKYSSEVIHGRMASKPIILDEDRLNLVWPFLGKVLVELHDALQADFLKHSKGFTAEDVLKFRT